MNEAEALRDMAFNTGVIELIAPSTWLQEVVNGVIVAVRRHRISYDDAESSLDEVLSSDIRLINVDGIDIFQTALRYNIAGYDAPSLTLALQLGATLYTGDRRFYDNVRNQIGLVRWIGDFRPSENP